MTSEQIAGLRRWGESYPADADNVPRNVVRLLDERESLLNAAKEAAEGFDVVAVDDTRLLALLRDAIGKAEAP